MQLQYHMQERARPVKTARSEPLTKKERIVLSYVQAGLSNREICFELGLSDSTVRTHLRNIFGKLGAQSRTHAVALAVECGEL